MATTCNSLGSIAAIKGVIAVASSALRLVCCFGLVCGLAGCWPSGPQRQAVQGTISLDGKPLSDVGIIFRPTEAGQLGSSTVAVDGEFSIERGQGPSQGVHHILVQPMQPDLEDFEALRAEGQNPLKRLSVPSRYTKPGGLQAEVESNGDNEFQFELTHRPSS